jgi:hypothetical protein
MAIDIRRREFVIAPWRHGGILAAHAMPAVGFINSGSPSAEIIPAVQSHQRCEAPLLILVEAL